LYIEISGTGRSAVLDEYGVVVVGGGVAGSVAARFSAKRGFRTLLIERLKTPRNKPCYRKEMEDALVDSTIRKPFGLGMNKVNDEFNVLFVNLGFPQVLYGIHQSVLIVVYAPTLSTHHIPIIKRDLD
jgi:hypothetical protein